MKFKKGDIIYHGWDFGNHYITEVKEWNEGWIRGNHCLWIDQENFKFEDNYQNNIGHIIRLATFDEIQWFNECIRNKSYVPFTNKQNYEIY
jgi:hypothetical protein